jgi:hypothetical protein
MRQQFWKPTLITLAALAMTALTLAPVSAQDRPEDRRPDDHQVMRSDEHRDDHRNDDHGSDDPAQRYRHDHPHSSARCHDGFFTATKDRSRACTKHGGIDVWLSL